MISNVDNPEIMLYFCPSKLRSFCPFSLSHKTSYNVFTAFFILIPCYEISEIVSNSCML